MSRLVRLACLALVPLAPLAHATASATPATPSASAAPSAVDLPGSQVLATRHVAAAATAAGPRRMLSRLPAGQPMQLSLLLAPHDPDGLKALLARLYDPASPDFHHYLAPGQFTDRFAPAAADVGSLSAYLKSQGLTVTPSAKNRMVLDVAGSAANVERCFHVHLGRYQHPTESRTYFGPDREPTIDAATPIWRIDGLDDFSRPHSNLTHAAAGSAPVAATGTGPGGQNTGTDMRAAYFPGSPLDGSGQTLAIAALRTYWPGDVQLYFTNTGFHNTVPIDNIMLDGLQLCSAACGDDGEDVIDIANAIGVAPGLSKLQVYVGNNTVDVLNRIASDDTAKTISMSWLWGPADPASDDPIFEQMAAQGQSFFAATGDSGSYKPGSLAYPATDPYVTAVGGTDLTTVGGSWSAETAWAGSSGGSAVPAIPAWQVSAITAANQGSTTQRNVPDVAAEANYDNYYCSNGRCAGGLGGTSFASPRWAGFIALANQQAAMFGKGPVGFLNPALYAAGASSRYGSLFHDITSGSNGAYQATDGYDLVTGWGSPIGPVLVDALTGTSLPGTGPTGSAWTPCATENGTCTTNGTQNVRYGADVSYVSRTIYGGSVACTTDAFGVDPMPGVVKSCDVAPTWTACASEGATCSFTGTQVVQFGTYDQAAYLTATGSMPCTTSAFGVDPAPGVAKQCSVSAPPAVATGWTSCAAESGFCSFLGTRTVAFGAGSQWRYLTVFGSTTCSSEAFGGDPLPGTPKACLYK